MSRNLRGRPHSQDPEGIEDGNGIIHTTSRSLRKINYAEIESGFDYLENEEDNSSAENGRALGADSKKGNDTDEDDEDEGLAHRNYPRSMSGSPVRRRGKRTRALDSEDDESFHEDEDLDGDVDEDDVDLDDEKDDDYFGRSDANRRRKLEDKSFIVPDLENDDEEDGEDDEENEYAVFNRRRRRRQNSSTYRTTHRIRNRDTTPPPAPRNLRRRTRSSHLDEDIDDADVDRKNREALTLEDEIRELQEDSPIQEKRSLRERTKPVNYKLPPPLTEANAEEYLTKEVTASFQNPSPRRGRGAWNASQNTGPARRLFPTGGPFGGNDVTTIFGKNTNFYGQGPLSNGEGNNNNKLIMDSDSSEDEILPMGIQPKPKKIKSKKKKAEIADLDPLGVDMNVKFSEVGGLDNYIDQLKEMVALPLLYPELYQNFNITPPRGVLFHGPPGTGKTLMARALAASCSSERRKITFFMRKGADVLSKWVGEAERQLRLLFEEAKKHQPSVIFFDEIDGLAPVRSSKQEQIHASIVSTLLALMDGMDNRGQVIVIGATNRPDAVDPALRRPGRFDREFYFPLPDPNAREQILKIHTKKWAPPLSPVFIKSLAGLTKGYGGADLRALCTEAALISIQRKYPQIYRSNDKLLVDPTKVKVNSGDFMMALKRIIPSSARSAGDPAQALPESIRPLLEEQLSEVKSMLQKLIPGEDDLFRKDASLVQHFITYESFKDDDIDGSGFAKHEMINKISDARIHQPKLLITGPRGNGQQYIGAAILNYFERFNVQKLDLASLVSDSSRTLESAVVQGFVEARKRQPSVLYIPSIEVWPRVVNESVILTLSSLMKSLQSNERVFILGIGEATWDAELRNGPLSSLFLSKNVFHIQKPSSAQRVDYFGSLINMLRMEPSSFETVRKRQKPLEPLPLAEASGGVDEHDDNGNILSPMEITRKTLRSFQHQDMKLKNVLKIKLSGLMDLFKNRYKRFRKPPIDDSFLIHLFEPPTDPNWQPAYIKDSDMILEVATGRRFYNMDLDLVEERLWNGYYSEPKQYLKDIELIYRDANTTGDREKIIKASEMFANAQMGIEEISTPEFIQECKATRKRDLERQELFLNDEKNRLSEEQACLKQAEAPDEEASGEIGVASGNQLQAQIINVAPEDIHASKDSLGFILNEDDSTSPTHDSNNFVGHSHSGKYTDDIEATNQPGLPSNHNPDKFAAPGVDFPKNGSSEQVAEQESHNAEDSTSEDLLNENGTSKNEVPNGKKPENTSSESIGNERDCNKKGSEESDNVVSDSPNFSDRPGSKIELDEDALKLIIRTLELKTQNYTVAALEEVYADIVEIAWSDRFLWNKLDTITKILALIDKI